MNNTKRTISWCDFSWNPIVGCKHGCWYCYAKKLCLRFKKIFPNGFEPTFHPERLKEPYELKKPSKIFVCSIADLFAPWTPKEWRDEVLKAMFLCPVQHTFQLLTKNPERIPIPSAYGHFPDFGVYPENWWFGATVTGEGDWWNINRLKHVPARIRFVSFEPLLGEIPFTKEHSLEGIQWVIIGKLTGSKRVKLKPEWVKNIVTEADRYDIPVFLKNNLRAAMGGEPPFVCARQEFPI